MNRMRTEPYKEDSTKGGSLLINPANYKGDVLVQVWLDSRVLATLCNWLDKVGIYPRHMSEVTRKPLESLAAHLVDTGEADLVDDTIVARGMLEARFGVVLNRGGKGGKNVMHNILLSEKRRDLTDHIHKGSTSDAQKPVRSKLQVDPAILKKAAELYQKQLDTEAEEAKKKAIDDAKDAGLVRP